VKTATYLRVSLLIPFLVWGISLLLFVVMAGAMPERSGLAAFGEAANVADFGILFLAFYVFGIVIWIIPYLLLGLILFFWSFIGQARTLIRGFALAPLAMVLLTISSMIVLDLGNQGQVNQDFMSFNLLVLAVTLMWGYICVGIGYGIYRLIQRRGYIKDEVLAESVPPVHVSL
jgi:hypothetical protein